MSLEVSVLSHSLKEDKVDGKPPRLFCSLLIEITAANETEPYVRLVISDCKLSGGVFKPPARPGGFQRVFFPQVYFLNGLRKNLLAGAIYNIAKELADKYNLPLAPEDECLADWLPDSKVLKNFQNISVNTEDIVWKK